MATSGTTIYELTRNQFIEAALRKIGRLALGQTPETTEYTNGYIAFNALVAEYQTLGMQLWKRNAYTLTLITNQVTYTFGVGMTINIAFPLKINQINLQDTSSLAQVDMNQLSVYDFNKLPGNSSGQPVNYSYQPFINYGVLSVWPKPDATTASTKTAIITYQGPLEGFTTGGTTDTADFPQEWQAALIYGLAVALAPEYGIPLEDRKMLMGEAKLKLDAALSAGNEEASMYFMPSWR